MSNDGEQMRNSQSAPAWDDSSSLQQTERFTAGTTWKLVRISRQAGLVVRYLGLSVTPPELAERLLAELQKNSMNPGPLPGSLASKVYRFCRRAD